MKLTEQQVSEIKMHMCQDAKILAKKFSAYKNPFDTVSVPHAERAIYEDQGFIFQSASKHRTKLVRQREIGTLYEQEIWCMFYRLGFRILTNDSNLRIQWGPNAADNHQIDVVAVGDDAIFVVECKATTTSKSANFKNEINAIAQYKDGVAEVLQEIYGADKKVKFIFATKNYRFSEDCEDVSRMKNFGIFHLNDATYQYIDRLIGAYKGAVKYQFHALLFQDELINEHRITIPALKGQMGGKTYYLFSIEPQILLKVGFILHRTKVNKAMDPTYQRLLVPSRLKGISEFIDKGGYFPNSIIVNFAAHSDALKLRFDSIHSEPTSKSEFGLLHIPNAYGIAYIIDGQHRVYGYANATTTEVNTLPVVAFDNIASEEQLKIFMDINENQKAVSTDLRIDLQSDLLWNAPQLNSRMKALRSAIIRELTDDSDNVLYHKIIRGSDPGILKSKPFETALSKAEFIPKCTISTWTGDTSVSLYNINETNTDKAMNDALHKITKFIDGCYAKMEMYLNDDQKDSFLYSNRSTYAFIVLMSTIHTHLIRIGVINSNSSIKERLNAVDEYIQALAQALNNLSDSERASINEALGQGADTKWLRAYQDLVNKRYPEYDPEGLSEWRETKDEKLQKEGNNLKSEIRDLVRDIVFQQLEKAYGHNWSSNIAKIKHECEGRILATYEDSEIDPLSNHDWKDWLEVTDFRKLISENYNRPEFAEPFSINIGLAFNTKKEKLYWMTLLEQAHGKKAPALTKSIVNQLWMIYDKLKNFREA